MKSSTVGVSLRSKSEELFWPFFVPLIIVLVSFLIGLFFMRPNMAESDSYREALSAIKFLDEGVYSSYWDHPLTMYIFVAATSLARALDMSQTAVLNTVAVLLGSMSLWPFFQLTRKFVNEQAAAFASAGFVLSPAFIRFSSHLSHEIVGFTFALWTLYLFEWTLAKRKRTSAFVFGFFLGATWSARPIAAMLIAPPLLVMLAAKVNRSELAEMGKRLLPLSVLGFMVCLIGVYRPALVNHLFTYSRGFLATFYEVGRYTKSTTLIALSSLTPVLVVLAAVGAAVLVAGRKYFIPLFAGSWILTGYLFYTGMYCRPRYFLILLPACLLLCFAGAEHIDKTVHMRRIHYFAKAITILLLIAAAFLPSLPDLLYYRKANDDKIASEAIGELVGGNLLFTTSLEPMILYYNRENPPETVYLVTEYTPGKLVMKLDAARLAQERLGQGRPVFATEEILPHFKLVDIDAKAELVWEYKTLQLFRLTSLRFADHRAQGSPRK